MSTEMRTVIVTMTQGRPSRAKGFVMSRITRYRTIGLLAVAATLTLSAVPPGQELSAAVASTAAQPVTVLAGRDYATTTFADPWDYSNGADLVLDAGPTMGLTAPSMSGGMVSFVTHSAYV
jgi:hypothetical protein